MNTWARGTVRWYWSAGALFWQLSIDHNIDVQLVFPWAPKLARKCESRHWFPCGADGRSYGHVITKFSRMGRLPNFLTYGAPPTLARFAHGWSSTNIVQIKQWNRLFSWILNFALSLKILSDQTVSLSDQVWSLTWQMTCLQKKLFAALQGVSSLHSIHI